jgi:hypothetical protein
MTCKNFIITNVTKHCPYLNPPEASPLPIAGVGGGLEKGKTILVNRLIAQKFKI